MGVGWISGRTTLLFTFFTLISFLRFLNLESDNPPIFKKILNYLTVNLFFLLALFSKETAAALPLFVFSYFLWIGKNDGSSLAIALKNGMAKGIIFFPAFLVYIYFRFSSNAFFPSNAPSYYKYKLSVPLILKNMSEYIIRSSLLLLTLLIFCTLALSVCNLKKRNLRRRFFGLNSIKIFGLLWFSVFLLPVLLLPVRSDLYVYFPQIGLLLLLTVMISNQVSELRLHRSGKVIMSVFFSITMVLQMGIFIHNSMKIRQEGQNSAAFVSQLSDKIENMPMGTNFHVIDYDCHQRISPVSTVSYGLSSFLNIRYPDLKLNGRIIKAEEKLTGENTMNFEWRQSELLKR